jgi:hypothetical protein
MSLQNTLPAYTPGIDSQINQSPTWAISKKGTTCLTDCTGDFALVPKPLVMDQDSNFDFLLDSYYLRCS